MHEPSSLVRTIRALRRHALCVVLIVLLWLALYVPGLWSPPLLDDADSVHAEAAREMMLRHDWSTLYINGLRYLEKAPLLYWGMAASYSTVRRNRLGRAPASGARHARPAAGHLRHRPPSL